MFDEEGKPILSAMAQLDAEDYQLRKVARDLAKCEPVKNKPARSSEDDLLETIGELVGREIKRLEQKIAELEQKQLKLGGVWKAGQRYQERTLVSHGGGLWLCLADTEARPGSGSPAWRLAVKRGDAQ